MTAHRFALAGMLVLTALVGRYGSGKSSDENPVSQSNPLSINGVSLGMTRAQVETLFRPFLSDWPTEPSLTQHFGMLPGNLGYSNGTIVRFGSLGANARVQFLEGVYLSFDGVEICREMWGEHNPDPRPAGLKQKLGAPDEIERNKDGVFWHYRRYQLTVSTSTKYPWHFSLGGSARQK